MFGNDTISRMFAHFNDKSWLLLSRPRVLELKVNTTVVDSHAVRAQMRSKKFVHPSIGVYKTTQVTLGRLFLHIDTENLVKLFRCPHATETIPILFRVIPVCHWNLGVHVHNSEQTLHSLFTSTRVMIAILPKVVHFAAYFCIVANGIVMKANGSFRRVVIVACKECFFLCVELHDKQSSKIQSCSICVCTYRP